MPAARAVRLGQAELLGLQRISRDVAGRQYPAPYLSGLESPADGKNIIRGLIARGYEDGAIRKIAGQNALDLFRRVIG